MAEQVAQSKQEAFDAMQAEIARLTSENAALKLAGASRKGLRLGVTKNGAVGVYGMRRFPFWAYEKEWEAILGMAEEIRAFLAVHKAELSHGKES